MSLSNLTENQRHGMSELFRRIAPVADELGELFAARGTRLALVGGSVRDVFLGRIGNDLDLTTDARPETVLEIVRDWADSIWTIGIDFGTVGVRKGGWLLEITTYRSESYDPKSRKPEVVYGDTLEGDLARRDFAVNAMAVRLPVPRVRRPARRPRRPARQGAAHARHARSGPSTTTRCGCSAPPGSPASSASPSTRRRSPR